MPKVICNQVKCGKPAVLKRPKTGDPMCKECFFFCFETEIHVTIVKGELFKRGDKVAIGASGGKDSTVLAYILKLLNERYDYGLDLFLLSIDEGISGYRDDSLETVKQNRDDYKLPLKILSYKDLYGWTMDEIVAQIGKKNNCTFCGVFRRQALDRGAAFLNADMIVTGHNADDIAETVIMNVLRGDLARLSRCTYIVTEGEGTIPRCKPLKFAYEKEIVMYAHYKKLVYFSTECIYSPDAYRGHTREFLKEIERVRPSAILDIIHSGETVRVKDAVKFPERRTCTRCGFVASQEVCKACVLLEGLNTGMPKLGIGKSNKAKKIMGIPVPDGSENIAKNARKNQPRTTESKKKIRREMKRKEMMERMQKVNEPSSCGRGGESCGSGCKSNNPESPTSEILEPSTQDEDIDDSSMLPPEANPFEELACGGSIDYSVPMSLENASDDEDSIIEVKETKERIVCKCPPRLRATSKDREVPSTDDDDSNTDDEGFSIKVFKLLSGLSLIKSSELPENTDSEFVDIDSELRDYLNDIENVMGSSEQPENTNSQSASVLTEKESTDITKLSTLTIKEPKTEEAEAALKEPEHDDSGSQSATQTDNLHQSTNDQPSIVKAQPKIVRPSLMLPEMMYKAKNNLDF